MRWVVTRCNLDLIFALSRLVRYLPDKLSIALNENLTNPGGEECFIRIPLEAIVDVKTHVDNNLDENLRRRLLAAHPNRQVHTDGILLPDVDFPDSGFLEEEGNPANLEDTVEQLYEALQQLLGLLIRGQNDQARVVATRIITAGSGSTAPCIWRWCTRPWQHFQSHRPSKTLTCASTPLSSPSTVSAATPLRQNLNV